jgi:hypothetical protein
MMAVWPSAPPSSVATAATRPGSSKGGVGGRQLVGHEDGAGGHLLQRAERRGGEVTDQPAAISRTS